MGRANAYRNDNIALRERLKGKEAELFAKKGLREQREVESATERSRKDNAARALLEIETEKTDLNHALKFARERNEWLLADHAEMAAKVETLEARLKFEAERAKEAEAGLLSRPTEEAAIRKFKASMEFGEVVKEAARQSDTVVAEVAQLREEAKKVTEENACLQGLVAVQTAEIAMLKKSDAAAATKMMKLSAKLEQKRSELAKSRERAKKYKWGKEALEKLLSPQGQAGISGRIATAEVAERVGAEAGATVEDHGEKKPGEETVGGEEGQKVAEDAGEPVVAAVGGYVTEEVIPPVTVEGAEVAGKVEVTGMELFVVAERVEPLSSVPSLPEDDPSG